MKLALSFPWQEWLCEIPQCCGRLMLPILFLRLTITMYRRFIVHVYRFGLKMYHACVYNWSWTFFFTIVWPCIVTDSLWIKPTGALNSNFIGITTLHVSGSLSAHHQDFLAIHRLWYILCSCDEHSSILLLVANGHPKCIKCSKTDVRLRTPDDGQKGCPKHVE